MRRLVSVAITLSLFAPSLPAMAADTTIELPATLPCGGTTGKTRARCITDALKTWKEMEHDYDQEEDDRVDAWKTEHAHMGVGSDYQKLLRDFLNQVHKERREFAKQLQAFRKEFFAEQKAALKKNNTAPKPTEDAKKLQKATLEEAKAKCGPEDDDGLFRTCMRQLLRGVPANVSKRSRSSNALLGK